MNKVEWKPEILDPGPPDRPYGVPDPGPEGASHDRPTVPRPTDGPAASALPAPGRSGIPGRLPSPFAGGPQRMTIPPARVIPPIPIPAPSQGTKLGIQPPEYPQPKPPLDSI